MHSESKRYTSNIMIKQEYEGAILYSSNVALLYNIYNNTSTMHFHDHLEILVGDSKNKIRHLPQQFKDSNRFDTTCDIKGRRHGCRCKIIIEIASKMIIERGCSSLQINYLIKIIENIPCHLGDC